MAVVSACAQTAQFPTAVAADSQLKVAVNRLQTNLTSTTLVGDTVLVVASTTGFVANMLVSVDSEIISICGVAGANVLNVGATGACPNINGRAFDGTTAAVHTSTGATCVGTTPHGCVAVLMTAWHHNVNRVEVEAIETALGASMANIPGTTSGPTIPINKGGTGQVTAPLGLQALLNGSTRGLNTTKVQMAASSAPGVGTVPKYDSDGALVDSGVLPAVTPTGTAPFQRYRADATTPFSGAFKTAATAYVPDFDFPVQTPGGTLTGGGGLQSITLIPCPVGIVANGVYASTLYITGGSGTAEALVSAGGTCTSGLASGTVQVSPANNHSGAWTVLSATGGIQEALGYLFATYGGGTAELNPEAGIVMHGKVTFPLGNFTLDGKNTGAQYSITRPEDHANGDLLLIADTASTSPVKQTYVRNLTINNYTTAAQSTGAAIYCVKVSCHIDGIRIYDGPHQVVFDAASNSSLNNFYLQNQAHALDAILFTATVGLQSNSDITVTNGEIFSISPATTQTSGAVAINIQAADGIGISHVRGAGGDAFIKMVPGGLTGYPIWYLASIDIDDLLVDGCAANGAAFQIANTASANAGDIYIHNSDVGGAATCNYAVLQTTSGGAPFGVISITDNNFRSLKNAAIQLNAAQGRQAVISGNSITDCNEASSASIGCIILNGASAIITNNVIHSSKAAWGILAEAGGANVVIAGNDLSGASFTGPFTTGPIAINLGGATFPTHLTMGFNLGVSDVQGTVASAATLTMPLNPNFNITGTTTITAIGPAGSVPASGSAWAGRSGYFTAVDGVVAFTAGATIGNTYAARRNVPTFYYSDGTLLWLGGLPTYNNNLVGANVASAATILPTGAMFHVTGTAAIVTVTLPAGFTGGCLNWIPDAAYTTTNAGNIAIASTGVIGKAMQMCYDPGTSKFYPSY
jgi:hypothetical protein